MLLELKGIQKTFGGVQALSDGNLSVAAGEAHLLLGENGAGKSTLMKIVAGMYERDAGQMLWDGREVRLSRPAHAAAIGIAMVHQESLLAPHLSVAENIFLGCESRRPFGWVDRGDMLARARRLIADHRFPLQAEWRVEKLRAVGDRVTILRDGRTVHAGPLRELSTDQIIHNMVGREVSAIYRRDPIPPGDELLRVEHLTRRGKLEDISFSLRAGEIVGLAGLIGAGRTELCRAIFGLDPIDSGTVRVSGREARILSPHEAVRAGIALLTEDRQQTGLALRLPVASNVTLANLA